MNKHVNPISLTQLEDTQTASGQNLLDLSHQHPLMVVFLRHFGCTFCREAMRELGKLRPQIEAHRDTRLVLVHMSPADYAEKMLGKYGLEGVEHISDPDCQLYRDFGLKKGTFKQLFGLKMWIRGFQVGVLEGLWVGRERGDGFQMPGYFLLSEGQVVHRYVPTDAADHPDFMSLAQCELS
jgi:peroxiredoxin